MALTCAAAATAQQQPLPMAELQRLVAAYSLLRDSFVEPVTGEVLMAAALRGMLQETDPEGGEYLTDEDLRGMREGQGQAMGHIEAQLLLRGGALMLLPAWGGPADLAGLRMRDRLLAVDGQAVSGLTTQQAMRLLQGPKGSVVKLTVVRGANGTPQFVEVTRGHSSPTQPSASRAGSALVLRVTTFRERTLEEVAELLNREWQQQPIAGLVLDLRRSQGGLLTSTIGMAALFLPGDALVAKTVGRVRESRQDWRAAPEHYTRRPTPDPWAAVPAALRALPLVVLVDEGTASGAEIVAAALRDHGRARIVGRATLGRTSIQTVTPLPGGGAIKITTAVWESPAGQRLDRVGLAPDLLLGELDPRQELDAALTALAHR